jgi:hypothetical protein
MSSLIIEYIIDYLVSNTIEAKILRENFIFKVIFFCNLSKF